jgi:hypothetical protein
MPAFTNDDLKTLGAFDQAQGSTNDQLRLLRGIANRVGLYDAADAINSLIVATPEVVAEPVEAEPVFDKNVDLEALYTEIEALVAESNESVVVLDAAMSDRIESAIGDADIEQAIDFVRRVMVDLRVMPTQTAKVSAMSDRMTKHLLGSL